MTVTAVPPTTAHPVGTVPHVVVIGGGFGGLNAVKAFDKQPVRVTLIDRWNHHLFQPLLYQVATGALAPSDIASPLRSILREQNNAAVVLAEVMAIDLKARTVHLADGMMTYDYLILAAGARSTYFGHEEWERLAPGLKSIDDAVAVRRRVFLAFEEAERVSDPAARARLMTFVIVGGGTTGVELAGAIAEVARESLTKEFRSIDPREARILLIDGGDRLLASFPPALSRRTMRDLKSLGVEIRLHAHVTSVEPEAVSVGDERIATATVIWAAGVTPSPLAGTLDVPLDGKGHVRVEPDLALAAYPDAFVIGDMAALNGPNGKPLPGVASVAQQQGPHAARNILRRVGGKPTQPFRYFDKGTLATIGRNRAVADIFGVRLAGFPAWFIWAFVHIALLIGFRTRFSVMTEWIWAYFTRQRGSRLLEVGPRTMESLANDAPPATTDTRIQEQSHIATTR